MKYPYLSFLKPGFLTALVLPVSVAAAGTLPHQFSRELNMPARIHELSREFNKPESGRKFSHESRRPAPRHEAVAPMMLPTRQQIFMMEDVWVLAAELTFDYDTRGNMTRMVADESGSINTTICEYDEYGNVTSRLDLEGEGEDALNKAWRTYEYDPVVHDFCIRRMGYDWSGTIWTPNYYCETNDVSRDAEGNVTEIIKSLPYRADDLVPAYRTVWGYGADGRADSYAYYENMKGKDTDWWLYDQTEYRDIIWERTDGQLLTQLTEMMEGNNRLLSAKVYYAGEPDGYVFVTYPPFDEPGFRMTFTTNDPEEAGIIQEFIMLDADTYAQLYRISYYFDEETEEISETPVYISENLYMLDHDGNPVEDLYYEQWAGGESELVGGSRYENTYDEARNLIETVQSDYDYESGEFFEVMRTLYSDYVDVTSGVGEVAAGKLLTVNGLTVTAEGEICVYGIDGRRVSAGNGTLSLGSLPGGIYILRAGAESVKVIKNN